VLLYKETHKTCQTYHLITDRLSLKEQATVCIKQDQDRAQSIKSSDMHTVGIHHIGCHDNYGKYFSVTCRDVKTVYFSELVTGLPKPVFTGYRKAYCERLLSVNHLLLHGGRGPHSRSTDAVAAKQRTVAYQSGRGHREQMLCRRELITIVTPLSQPGSAKTAASVCLYSVYRKQKKTTVHSRVRADIKCADCHHPAASEGGPVVSHTQHPVGDRIPLSRCTSAF